MEITRFIQKLGYVLKHRYLFGIFSFWRKIKFRVLGMHVGKQTKLPKIYVTWPHKVSIGEGCHLEHDIYFKFDGVWQPGVAIAIDDRTFIGSNSEFNIIKEISIGKDCLIASGCRFIDHDHGYNDRNIPMNISTTGKEASICIEEDVWLGCNVVVLKGVTIGKGAIIAAGAVVNTSVPAYEMWGGVPARKIGER